MNATSVLKTGLVKSNNADLDKSVVNHKIFKILQKLD